jgi:hypothetical protein
MFGQIFSVHESQAAALAALLAYKGFDFRIGRNDVDSLTAPLTNSRNFMMN